MCLSEARNVFATGGYYINNKKVYNIILLHLIYRKVIVENVFQTIVQN